MEAQLTQNNLLELCNKMHSLKEEFINNHQPSRTITLLLGLTGAGKSTFFNFLCGAEFVYNGKHLELKEASHQFSIMQGGMVSVTKEPKFYMNVDNKHLLIDYPGFQDTTGWVDQLLFDLLFNKIVSMGEVKIIYVINNPDNNLPTRGTDLQAFISQLENPNFNLLLNSYNEEMDDEELINEIKEELKQVKCDSNIDKIIVQRKAKKGNLDKLFKDNDRQIFWNQIQAMNKVLIKPRNIPKSQLISEFLISEATKKIQENVKVMLDFFNRKSDETNQQQNEDMLANLKLFKELMQNDKNLTALQWFEQFINICEKLTNSDNQQQTKVGNDFISLFQYFEQFKEFINGYQQLQTINEIGKQAFKQIEILIDTKIELIERWKQAEEERKKAEEERLKAEQDKKKAEEDARKEKKERQKAEQDAIKQKQERQKAEQDVIKEKQERQKAEQDAIKEKQERQKAEQDVIKEKQERQKAEQDAKKEKQERQKAEEERQKAEQDAIKQKQERQKAEQDMRRMAEQERQRAEEDKRRMAELERQMAEYDKRQAEQERKWAKKERQAEEDKRRAEQERQRAEEDKKKAEQERQKQMQQESKRNLEEQQRREIENKQIQERERLKIEQEQKQYIENYTFHKKDDEDKMQYDLVNDERDKYTKEQFELRKSLFGGADWSWVYNKKIEDYDRECQRLLDRIHFSYSQLAYSSHD